MSNEGIAVLKFSKKPVVIEAFQMTQERRMDNREWPEWLNEAWNKNEGEPGALFRQNMDAPLPDVLCIQTLEGAHLVSWGDWIIRGVQGELYSCKPDIFELTYEPALGGKQKTAGGYQAADMADNGADGFRAGLEFAAKQAEEKGHHDLAALYRAQAQQE